MYSNMSHDIIKQIQIAFNGVKLDNGISLNETEYFDSRETNKRFLELSKTDERDDWSKIDDKTLEKFQVTFCFTDVSGFRFYAPAYMIWAIKNFKESHTIIADHIVWNLDPDHYVLKPVGFNKVFNKGQVLSIVKFLEFVIENKDYMEGDIAARNLDKIKTLN